jgi:hypothetical protein
MGDFCNFLKKVTQENNFPMAKIRPIWSTCFQAKRKQAFPEFPSKSAFPKDYFAS